MNQIPSQTRANRTRTRLHKALISLVAYQDYAALTIKDVTDLAGLNRTTFYLHYSGLHELLEDCARDLFSQMRMDIYSKKPLEISHGSAGLQPYVESVFHHLEQHEKFYRAMLGKHGAPFLRALFQDLLSEVIFEPIFEKKLIPPHTYQLQIALRFFSAGFTGIASWWLENSRPISADQAAQLIARDILPGYLHLMEA